MDVTPRHRAYDAIERAYADGVMEAVDGNAETGTGVFMPEERMTYAQFVTVITQAFYQDELKKNGIAEGEPWYSPHLRTAFDRGILTNSLGALMDYADNYIYRYDMAKILVQLLDDKSVVLPSRQDIDQATAKIADWDKVKADKYWQYYVPCAYAMGLFDGIEELDTFAGSAGVTRAMAAAVYVRAADQIAAGQNDSKAFQVIFEGDWEQITSTGYKEKLEKEFYTVYPRLWARWGNAKIPKIITVYAKRAEDMEVPDAAGVTVYDYNQEQYRTYPYISISIDFANEYPDERVLSHEMTHVMQGYAEFRSEWWNENMAGYGRFRYCAWADAGSMDDFDYHLPQDPSLLTWEYSKDDNCHWFFAYTDGKYPTTKEGYGLIDTIHQAIRRGEIISDGGRDQSDSAFNAIVQKITGYANIEQLRQKYKQELEDGTWTFNSFAGYTDNYIIENLPGVMNPTYPVLSMKTIGDGAFLKMPRPQLFIVHLI